MPRDIQLPDGRILRLTGDETPEQLSTLKEKLRTKYETPEAQEQEPVQQRGLSQDLSRRGAKASEILAAQQQGQQTLPETAFQLGGEAVDVFGDVLSSAITSGYGALPVPVQEALKETAQIDTIGRLGKLAGQLPVGRDLTLGEAIPQALGGLSEAYGGLGERTKRNIEALGSVGTVLTPMKGPLVGRGVQQTGTQIKQTIRQLIPDAKKVSADDIAKESNKAYQLADELGGTISSKHVGNFIDDVNRTILPQTKAGKIVAGSDDEIAALVGRVNELKGKPISLAEFQEIDELLGDAVDTYVQVTGKVNKKGKKILDIQRSLRKNVDEVTKGGTTNAAGFEALSRGRDLWRRQAKLRDIEKIFVRAQMSNQPTTTIKSALRTLAANPKNLRGYTKTEVEAIKKAAKTGSKTELLNMFGSRLPSIVAVGTGQPLVGGALRLGAIPARELATAGQMAKLDDLAQLIARGGVPEDPLTMLQRGQRGLGTLGAATGGALERTGGALGSLEGYRAKQAAALGLLNEQLQQ